MLRAACCGSVVLVVMIAACSSDDEGPVTPGIGRPTGHPTITLDQLEAEMLAGVEDEPVPMTEEELDKYFPLVGPLAEAEKQTDSDPTKGDASDVEKTFNAFVPTESPDDHFTIDVIEAGVTPAEIERVKKGVLFGMATWDRLKPGMTMTAASKMSTGGRPFKVSIKKTPDANASIGWRPYVSACGGTTPPPTTPPEVVAAIQADTCIPRLVLTIGEPAPPLRTRRSPSRFARSRSRRLRATRSRKPNVAS